jgi:polyhydroxyalkanoate synthase
MPHPEHNAFLAPDALEIFERMDHSRQMQGATLASMGFTPASTPYTAVLALPGVELRRYGDNPAGPPLLLVPAPIKRSYIWDLTPESSVVQRCVHAGLDVFLVDWQNPDGEAGTFGLADYADRLLLACVDAIGDLTHSQRVAIAGHSLGGTFAGIFATLHPERVAALALLASPLRFGRDVGIFGNAVTDARARGMFSPAPGSVPGSLLTTASFLASPDTFGWERIMDWYQSMADPEALRVHLLVERWALDEAPIARALFQELAEWLCLEDRFMQGGLAINGKAALPANVTAPVLAVADRRCPVVPPESILPFVEATSSADKRVLWYDGDVGVGLQHVGVLVGRSAHRTLWPQIIAFLRTHTPRDMPRPKTPKRV